MVSVSRTQNPRCVWSLSSRLTDSLIDGRFGCFRLVLLWFDMLVDWLDGWTCWLVDWLIYRLIDLWVDLWIDWVIDWFHWWFFVVIHCYTCKTVLTNSDYVGASFITVPGMFLEYFVCVLCRFNNNNNNDNTGYLSALGIWTSGHGIHWISRPTLYQLSHHVPHFCVQNIR